MNSFPGEKPLQVPPQAHNHAEEPNISKLAKNILAEENAFAEAIGILRERHLDNNSDKRIDFIYISDAFLCSLHSGIHRIENGANRRGTQIFDGLDLIKKALHSGLNLAWIVANETYGSHVDFRDELSNLGVLWIVEIPANSRGWLKSVSTKNKKAPKVARTGQRNAKRVDHIRLEGEFWCTYFHVRDTTKKPIVWCAKRARFFPQKNQKRCEEMWLIAAYNLANEKKYFLSNAPADISADALLRIAFADSYIENSLGVVNCDGMHNCIRQKTRNTPLERLLPTPLFLALFQYLAPILAFESVKNLFVQGTFSPGNQLTGNLNIQKLNKTFNYELKASPNSPSIRIKGDGVDVELALKPPMTKEGNSPLFRLNGRISGRQFNTEFRNHNFTGTSEIPLRFVENDGRQEKWLLAKEAIFPERLTANFKPQTQKKQIKKQIKNEQIATILQQYGLNKPLPFTMTNDEPVLLDDLYRVTNEDASLFPALNLRGGAYLGVGATQNYDHLTAIRAEAVFLLDLNPQVIADHKGLLALISISESPRELLSKLACAPLSPEEQLLSIPNVLALLLERPENDVYRRQVEDELKQKLPAGEAKAASLFLNDGRFFISNWLSGMWHETHGFWLSDSERFNHLRFLKNSGRIFLAIGDFRGKKTLSALGKKIKAWNKKNFPALTFTLIYTSNVPVCIDEYGNWWGVYSNQHMLVNASSRFLVPWLANGNRGVRGMLKNLSNLPLHPMGVLLTVVRNFWGENFSWHPQSIKTTVDYYALPLSQCFPIK